MFASIGFGGISVNKIIVRLLEQYRKEHEDDEVDKKIEELFAQKPQKQVKASHNGVVVKGIDNCLVKLSKCCNPLPGDDIIGYITKGRGVSVHRTDCVNVKSLFDEEQRIIDVYWVDDIKGSYSVEIEIEATDRQGLLRDIIKQIDNLKINLIGMNTRTTKERIAIIDLSVQIENKDLLNKLTNSINNVEGVYNISRRRG